MVVKKSYLLHKYVLSVCYVPDFVLSAVIQQFLEDISWHHNKFILMGVIKKQIFSMLDTDKFYTKYKAECLYGWASEAR